MFGGKKCLLIGAVHVHPLPGAAGYSGDMREIVRAALSDATAYAQHGMDAIILENMHDVPYLRGHVEPETTAAMAVVAQAVRKEISIPIGIQILAGANIEALGVAVAAGLDFLRVEGFVYSHIGDEGFHDSCAAQLIRRRGQLRAEHIKIFADIKKKHSAHAITADVSLEDTAETAEFFRADGVIVTGTATGKPPGSNELKSVRAATSLKVMVGSGVTPENAREFVPHADALIVGTSCKIDSDWKNPVCADRTASLVKAVKVLAAG